MLLVLAWYLASPLLIDEKVNEENILSEDVAPVVSGNFQDADDFHKVSGIANIFETDEMNYLRFENFKATNGPDLKVYLSNDLNANDYVSLGDLKGNEGNQNYNLTNIDYENYQYVLIWCEAFSVLFGYSEIESVK